MMLRTGTRAAAMVVSALFLLSACGSGSSSPSATTANPGTSSSAATTMASPTSASGAESNASGATDAGPVTLTTEECNTLGTALIGMSGPGFAAVAGGFTQADFDDAFPAGQVDSIPEPLKAAYTELESIAKGMIGTSDLKEASAEYSGKLAAVNSTVEKACPIRW